MKYNIQHKIHIKVYDYFTSNSYDHVYVLHMSAT